MPVEFITSSRSCYEPGHAGLVSRCSFHPRQPVLACAIEGGRVCVYQQQNLIDSSIVLPFSHWKETVLHGNTQCPVLCLEWSVDGSRLAVGCKNGTVILWDCDGRLLFERRKHTDFIWNIRWNAIQLNIFATGSNDRSAMVWDADKKPSPLVQRFVVHDGDRVHDVVWISENQFASFSRDQTDGIIHICQIGKETPVMTFVHGDPIDSIHWNRHLNLLASVSSCSKESVQIWSAKQTDPVSRCNNMTSDVSCIDWFPGNENHNNGVDHSTSLMAGGCVDGSIFVWNFNDEARHHERFDGHPVEINEISFSPNGKWLASIDRDGNLIVRFTKDWRKVYETRTNPTQWKRALSWNCSGDKLAIVNISFEVFLVESIIK